MRPKCECRKSFCSKNYCICLKNGFKCTSDCSCDEKCMNCDFAKRKVIRNPKKEESAILSSKGSSNLCEMEFNSADLSKFYPKE